MSLSRNENEHQEAARRLREVQERLTERLTRLEQMGLADDGDQRSLFEELVLDQRAGLSAGTHGAANGKV
jgi:hypothetical protein